MICCATRIVAANAPASSNLIADQGFPRFMSRSGNFWDNVTMESFYSSLKTERTARKACHMRDGARADVFDYIERFYSQKDGTR